MLIPLGAQNIIIDMDRVEMMWEDTLYVLSKPFTISTDPLLIVRDPYTQNQTENQARSYYLVYPFLSDVDLSVFMIHTRIET